LQLTEFFLWSTGLIYKNVPIIIIT